MIHEILSWRFAVSLSSFVALAAYMTWLYAVMRRQRREDHEWMLTLKKAHGQVREDINFLAEALGIDLTWEEPNPVEPDTEELPVVQPEPPATVEAEAADTFARKEVVLARHREGSRSVADILSEAGLEPIKRRRW